jgi:hypothetical protein
MTSPGPGHEPPEDGKHRHLLLIGGQRCGTTWLQRVLADHHDVRLPKVLRPEPKFLLDDDRHDRYDQLFAPGGGSLLLDKSTTYLERVDAAERAARCVPDASVIVIVRDPVQRAISNWRFSLANGFEDRSLDEALSETAEAREWQGLSTSPFQYLRRGRYADLIEPWSRAFGDRVVVIQHERAVAVSDSAYLVERLSVAGVKPQTGWPRLIGAVNESPTEGKPDESLLQRLGDYYEEPNERMRQYGIDLALWRSG